MNLKILSTHGAIVSLVGHNRGKWPLISKDPKKVCDWRGQNLPVYWIWKSCTHGAVVSLRGHIRGKWPPISKIPLV